jgi:RimJ/RimL family protein N-acetyltransferase
MTVFVETPRLQLREWREEDIAPFVEMGQSADVMRHFPALMPEAETRTLVTALRNDIATNGHGAFAVARKDNGAFIGLCGCKAVMWPHSFPTNMEIGWRFAPSAWGHGFATEAARAALNHCFALTKIDLIVSFTVPANKPSWSVMERPGNVAPDRSRF